MISDTSDTGGAERRERVRRIVLDRGFDRVGFAEAGRSASADRFREWLARGFAGTMDWLARSADRREDPRRVLEGARTVIAVALHHSPPAGAAPGGIAAYARGRDYHPVMERRLRAASEALRAAVPGGYRWYVDTGPVLERDWASRAGLGWIGKNACSIDPTRGSWYFLGAILSTIRIEPDLPAASHCGSCRLCIDACPTAAIVAPGEVDARRCISYLTIEHRGAIAEELEPLVGTHVFGCDICQAVCPFNRPGVTAGGDPELAPRPENEDPPLGDLAALDPEAFRRRFAESPVRRARPEGFLRNVIIALGNAGGPDAVRALDALAGRDDVRSSAALRETLDRARARVYSRTGPISRPSS